MASFIDNRREYDRRVQLIENLSRSYVLVGFQQNNVTHTQVKDGRTKQAGEYMAQIAAENEFGTNEIPARPFMSTAFAENNRRLVRAIQTEYGKILNGTSTIQRSLQLIGLFGVSIVQKKIQEIRTPPNSPRTIAIKKSSKPLIDFGQMVQSVQFSVVAA